MFSEYCLALRFFLLRRMVDGKVMMFFNTMLRCKISIVPIMIMTGANRQVRSTSTWSALWDIVKK